MLLRLTCLLLLSLCPVLPAWAADPALAEVRPGLYAGGQPTAAQLRGLAAQGVRTVIDLRQPDEDRGFDETREAEALGLRYVRIPVAGAEGLDAANVRAVHQALRQSQGPVLLHCASGNRAGAVLGLLNARYEHAPLWSLEILPPLNAQPKRTSSKQKINTINFFKVPPP